MTLHTSIPEDISDITPYTRVKCTVTHVYITTELAETLIYFYLEFPLHGSSTVPCGDAHIGR